jgi:polyphosphate kinase 2 (PPK2 family)
MGGSRPRAPHLPAAGEMFQYCDIKQAPWFVVNADSKKLARLNCIHHLLKQIP